MEDERGIALDRSIKSLRKAAESRARPAPALADLAAALLVRAERTQAPRDLLEAYETAEQAVEREPRNPAALFNRALALDRFGLVDESARAWLAYLAIDSTSGWAGEARRRLGRVRAVAPASRPPAADAPLAAYRRYAADDPQGARELGMDRLLAEWGDAMEVGDGLRAEDRLHRAAALGEALERRPGGDASLADAVRFIRGAAGDDGATRALARAHSEYGAGASRFDEADYAGAESRYRAAVAGPSPVLRGWSRVYAGTTRVLNGGRDQGERILRETAAVADPARHPALAARARWSLGSTLNRSERYETGLEEGRESARLFTRAGERG
jgi:tetratricopeptide (TPR) repeat protein